MTQATKACPYCGEEILAVAVKCRHCREYLDPSQRKSEFTTFEKAALPVGRPVSAIVAGYAALFAILPVFGLPFAIAAWVCGWMALKKIKAEPHLAGRGRAWFGVVVGVLMTLISLAFLALLIVGSIAEANARG